MFYCGSRDACLRPRGVEAVLESLLEEPSLARGVLHHEVIPARDAEYAAIPDWLDPRIRDGLAARGVDRLYSHQAAAMDAIRAGRDVVVVTPTASGKTLCYALPVLQAIAEDPSARALFLFPTKALSQDQVAEFGELTRASGLTVNASTYDGDTPAPIRSAVRTAGQVVVTNPDMLHSAILPHHTKWYQLFEQLRVIVIDELHTYRGHLRQSRRQRAAPAAPPLRPLWLASRSSSAARRRSGTRASSPPCSPAASRWSSIATAHRQASATSSWSTRRCSIRRAGREVLPPRVAQRWALPFLRAGRQTIVFGRSRVAVEILLTGLREALRGELRAAFAGAGLPRWLPAHGTAGDRARPA